MCHSLFNHSPVSMGCFKCLAVLNKAAINNCVQVFFYVIRNCPPVFQKGSNISHFYQQCVSDPVLPYPLQLQCHHSFYPSHADRCAVVFHCLTCIPRMASLFQGLVTISIFFCSCLFMSFAHILIGQLFLFCFVYLLQFDNFLYILDTIPLLDMLFANASSHTQFIFSSSLYRLWQSQSLSF